MGSELMADRLAGVAASFAAAADASGGISSDRFQIAGAPVWLRFASPALRDRLTPAFAHLEVSSDVAFSPGLTVHLWDSASTGAIPPPRPQTLNDQAAGALFHFHEPPLRAAYQPRLESLSILNTATGVAWHWASDALDQPYWDLASPIRQILFWWLASRGYMQLHGGAVGTRESGGVLLVGKGGSGKSTVTLSSLGSKLLYAGDDYVAVTLDPSPRVESLYSSGKLEPAHVHELLPWLLPVLANADRLESEKAVIYVHQHFPAQVTSGFPLRAILVPNVKSNQTESRIVDVSRASAFAALAPSTIFQLHTAGPDALAMMSRLIEQVPCYGLEVGVDLEAIPVTIADFLSRLPSS